MDYEDWQDKQALKDRVKECVHMPQDDKGEWAPKSLAVVYLDNGIGKHGDAFGCLEYWQEVDDIVKTHGFNVYSEFVNAAVTAYYVDD